MEILKTATEWAKDEVFSSKFFIFFGILAILATIGFWQLGKTEIAKAFIYPTLVAGTLLLMIGFGILYANHTRVTSFTNHYNKDRSDFITSEIIRTQKSIQEYETIVFKIIPIIIIVAALFIVFFDKPIWRAISTTTIALMVIILFVDNNANARIKAYHKELKLTQHLKK